MLKHNEGTTVTIAALAIVGIVVAVVDAIAGTVQGKGNSVNAYFSSVSVPAAP
jgi:hypothetical protein